MSEKGTTVSCYRKDHITLGSMESCQSLHVPHVVKLLILHNFIISYLKRTGVWYIMRVIHDLFLSELIITLSCLTIDMCPGIHSVSILDSL